MTISSKTRKMVSLKKEYNELKEEVDKYHSGERPVPENRWQRYTRLRGFFYPQFRYHGWENPLTGEILTRKEVERKRRKILEKILKKKK